MKWSGVSSSTFFCFLPYISNSYSEYPKSVATANSCHFHIACSNRRKFYLICTALSIFVCIDCFPFLRIIRHLDLVLFGTCRFPFQHNMLYFFFLTPSQHKSIESHSHHFPNDCLPLRQLLKKPIWMVMMKKLSHSCQKAKLYGLKFNVNASAMLLAGTSICFVRPYAATSFVPVQVVDGRFGISAFQVFGYSSIYSFYTVIR